MALVTLSEVLAIAQKEKIAVPAFNIDNIVIAEAIMEAAENEQSPVILSIGQGVINVGQLYYLSDIAKRLANNSRVPVVLHLDHGISFEQVILCLRAGFTSVMYDGSHYDFSENITTSTAVIRAAHAVGVSVECELGAIQGVEDGISNSHVNLVDLQEVKEFISTVHCDALAVGIGNAHGMYKATPHLDFHRLQACVDAGAPPLVLHGGSGIPDVLIRQAIDIGIRKINVATEIRFAYIKGLGEKIQTNDIYAIEHQAKKHVFDVATKKIRLFLNK
jgi:fructose-bisphosphate aldolase class II